ncbi:hypothetical protein Bbelb_230240 [Branchiostoma belcheri]|nr:hypothetical protein Bbelb_230240 [Branchiostoma belcheri]
MYTLNESEDPSSMMEMFHVSKSPVKYLREMQIQSPSQSHRLTDPFRIQSNCLLATSEFMKRQGTNSTKECPETSMVVKVTRREVEGNDVSEEWIISSCMGTSTSLQLALDERGKTAGLVPCGGVAALVKSSDDSHQDASKDSRSPNGEAFCFLPLSIPTGLPVHVNGGFAVASNRRGLWEETSTDRNDLKVEWNKALMEDAVCKAYITMLLDLSDMAKKGLLPTPYQYHSFWPNPRHITGTTHFSVLVKALFAALSSSGAPPSLFESGGQWLSFTSAVFLDSGMTFKSGENVAAKKALQQCLPDYTVVELPEWARQGFEQAGCAKPLSEHTYTEERFYRKLFFPRIHELSGKTRDPLMLRILGRENGEYNDLIQTTACIPTSPRGQELSCPGDLIHPDGKLSAMFLPEDQRFPHGSKDTYLKPSRLQVLTELGMCKDDAPWDVVIERAESVALMQKPREWPFDWKGSDYPADALLYAAELQPSKNHEIAGVSCPIMCSRIVTAKKGKHSSTYTVPTNLSSFLGLEDKSPNLSETLANLMAIIAVDMKTLSKEGLDCTKQSYLKTCQHLQNLSKGSKDNENEIGTRLYKTPFIMIMSQTTKRFLLPSDVSFDLKFSCAPYLYRVPDELATELRPLLSVCKVKTAFEACDFLRALDHLKEDRGNKRLKSHEVNLALQLLKVASDQEKGDIQKHSLWIPDETGVLRRPSDVCYNDCAWIKQRECMVFCHKGMARSLAVEKLGVKPVRHKSLEAYSHNLSCFGTDFGQVEKLTTRINHLLDAYPFGKEILKELLQNADDAGATEIHFVFDKRQHGTKYIFDDSWKGLQGPALCVYNNRPFTEEDLTGIQNLGKGSKAQDPVKTGKYGVGFNAVYHLTDCPSFMTGGDTLCIFDPQLRFVPGARQDCPGRMLQGIDADLREQYKDVFGCYLKDQPEFSSPDSTVFRFPLRTAAMAEGSELSNKEVTEETIMDLIDTFKKESFEVLLFVNSVEKIKISIIETDGTSNEFYHAEALISEEAKQDRRKFADYVAECAHSKEPLDELPTHHVTYNLDLRDNSQHNESWIVHQRIGFEDKDIPNSIKEAHASNELGLLPRGGAAICHKHCKQPYLSKAHHQSTSNQKCYHKGHKRAFCFLPLPIETHLPVHVNGHFALDHEARRNLWRDEKGGMKSDWNKTLIKEVIAPAYAEVLEAKRAADFDEEQKPSATSKARGVNESLESYHSLFPYVSKTPGEWKDLSIAFYQHIDRKHLRLLPVIRSTADDCRPSDGEPGSSSHHQMTLEWLPPTGAGKDEAFFNTLTYDVSGSTESRVHGRQVLEKTLLALGFNLLASPTGILRAFEQAKVDVKKVKPESVVDFLQTHADDVPLCRIGASLPAQVSSTRFKEPENLQVVLHYCLSAKKAQEEDQEYILDSQIESDPQKTKQEHALHGLPLLLTADNILRVFDVSCPVFATKYADLVPSAPHLFVDRSCLSDLQRQDTDKSVLSFDVEALCNLLPRELNESKFRQGNTVEWNQSPSQHWIYRLWQFLDHEMPKEKKSDQDTYLSKIKTLFGNWAVLPACTHSPKMGRYDASTFSTYERIPMVQPGKPYMVPLCKAHTVVTFDVGASSSQQIKVAKAMRKLHCLELNIHSLRGPPDRPLNAKPTQLARRFVSSLTNHVGILRVLTSLFDAQEAITPLDANDATELLKYFEEEVDKLKTVYANLDMLRSLPLYKTIHKKLISLPTTGQCHVLPTEIPPADMDAWIKRSDAVFLEKIHKLERLHEVLGCSGITDAEVYQQYIFPNMDHLSDEAVKVHLRYLRDLVQRSSKEECQPVIEGLKRLPLIPSHGGRRRVNDFYDDTHRVFREMVPVENFLPVCYRCGEEDEIKEWRQFFIKIGLNRTVTKAMFLHYAREVERLAKVTRSKESRLTEKSNVLVEHFFTMETLLEGGFIEEVSGIRFIEPVEAKPDLVELHSQYGANCDALPFVCFKDSVPEDSQELCWTTANLLPDSVTQELRYYGYRPDSDSEGLRCRLGIQVYPSIDTVSDHATCLCQHLAQQKATETEEGANSPSACETLLHVMQTVYRVLCWASSKAYFLKEKLGHVPCIVVEEGRKLVRPEQIAIELPQEYEIRPHLYGLPKQLGPYHVFFVSIGAPEKPTPLQYAKVLEQYYLSSKGAELADPNEKNGSRLAVAGLFRSLKASSKITSGRGVPSKTRAIQDSFRQLQNLYLPSRQNRLCKVNDLVFDDTPQFKNQIKNFKYPFLVPLGRCHLKGNEQELISLLPKHLTPKRCSSLVQETLCDECEQMACFMGEICDLETRFSCLFRSPQFSHAIHRLVKNGQNVRCDEETLTRALEKTVSSMKICCKQKLVTRLLYKEPQEEIQGSRENSLCFIEDSTLYIAHTEMGSGNYNNFIFKLIHVINYALGRPLEDPSPLSLVFSANTPSEIQGKLDMAGIQRLASGQDEEEYLHDLGTPIPEIYHHLLTSNPAHYFSLDEYVGFEVYDSEVEAESEDYTMTFLYAKVVKEVSTDADLKFGLGRKYVIDLGETKQTVSAADLYKFGRPSVSGPLVPYEGETDEQDSSAAKPPQSLEDATEEVSNILEEAWKLSEAERKKVVRRLYLQWHPDKNPDNVELATEVTKHILAEISRLERGSSFSSSFTRWNAYAGYHRHQREQFHERYRGGDFSGWRTGSGQWVPPRSDGGGFPNPREAARWHRQAAADLRAARGNLNGPDASYEWTCLMCHQAAEKALKAVQLGKFGRYDMIHQIGGMGRALEASCGGELAGVGDAAMELSSLGSHPGCDDVYLRARYPNLHPVPRVPHDAFTRQHAETAVRLAQTGPSRRVHPSARRNRGSDGTDYTGQDGGRTKLTYNLHPAPRVPNDAFTRQHAETAVRLAQTVLDRTEDALLHPEPCFIQDHVQALFWIDHAYPEPCLVQIDVLGYAETVRNSA